MSQNFDATSSPGAPPASDPPPATSPAGGGAGLRPPLRRSRDHRVVAGVCGGLGEYFGIDPVLFRVVVVVLALFGGWGLLLYVLAWVLIPEAPMPGEPAPGSRQRSRGNWWIVGVVVLMLVVLPWLVAVVASVMRQLWWRASGGYADVSMPMSMPWHLFWPGPSSLLLLVGAGAVIWWLIRRGDAPHGPDSRSVPSAPAPMGTLVPDGTVTTTLTTGYPTAVESTVYPAPGEAQPTVAFAPAAQWTEPVPVALTPTPPPPKRPRSVLGPLTVSVAALVAGVLLALDTAGRRSIPVSVVLATTLAVVALGLLVGAWVGRSRGLIVLGIVLSLVTAAVAALPSIDVSGGVGYRRWDVRTAMMAAQQSPYRLGIGNAKLDVEKLATVGTTVPVAASVGVGSLIVYVPTNADLRVTTHVGLGAVQWQGWANSTQSSGHDLNRTFTIDRPRTTTEIVLDLSVDVGQITVIQLGSIR